MQPLAERERGRALNQEKGRMLDTLDPGGPVRNDLLDHGEVELMMKDWIFSEIILRQAKQGSSRTAAVLLDMHKCAGELDQSLVVVSVGTMPIPEPKFLQHVVRFVKELPIEAIEIAQIIGAVLLSLKLFDARRDMPALFAHGLKLELCPQSLKLEKFPGFPQWLKNLTERRGADCGLEKRALVPHPARMAKPALGRGLGALLGGTPVITKAAPTTATTTPTAAPSAAVPVASPPAPDNRDRVQRVKLDRIRPSPLQPRKDFTPEALRELADSIKEQGIVQPLIVRERNGMFELIAGERRWRAAQSLALPEVPVIVREADDRSVLEMALIENLQRENLNPIEEALGYAQLVGQFHLTQEEVAVKVGKSRTVVANAVRLLRLSTTIQGYIRDGRLSVGHAKVILGLLDDQQQKVAAERIIKEALNVRQTEGLVTKLQNRVGKAAGKSMPPTTNAHVADLENRLRERFGTKVHLRYAQGKGAVEVSFFSDDELERILQIVGVKAD